MAITKNLEIKINGDTATFTEKFYIYQNDRGIDLNIKVSMPKLQINKKNTSLLAELEGASGGAIILKPNGEVIGKNNLTISDDVIKFTIDHSLTDDFNEIGIYKIQFHLYDNNNSRITIPPVQFEVKKLLGLVGEEDVSHEYGIVDTSLSDYCIVADDGEDLEAFLDGKYIKTTWNSGDLITSSKLNKIEDAIGDLDGRFYIGREPLHIDPIVWVDVPDLDNPYTVLDSSFYSVKTTQ